MLPHGEKYHTFPSLHPRRRLLRASTPVYLSVPLRTAPFIRTRSRRSAPLSHTPHRLENGTGQRKNVRRISRAKRRKDGLFSGLFRYTLRTQRPRLFVPPVFDLLQPDGFFKTEEAQISQINHRIEALEHSDLRASLLQQAADRKAAGEQVLKEARNALKEAKRQRDLLRASDHNDFTEEQLTRESRFLKAEYKRLEKQWKAKLEEVETALKRSDEEIEALKTERKRRSVLLQNRLFAQFRMLNARGRRKTCGKFSGNTGDPYRHRVPESVPLPNCCNMPTVTAIVLWPWPNSGGGFAGSGNTQARLLLSGMQKANVSRYSATCYRVWMWNPTHMKTASISTTSRNSSTKTNGWLLSINRPACFPYPARAMPLPYGAGRVRIFPRPRDRSWCTAWTWTPRGAPHRQRPGNAPKVATTV